MGNFNGEDDDAAMNRLIAQVIAEYECRPGVLEGWNAQEKAELESEIGRAMRDGHARGASEQQMINEGTRMAELYAKRRAQHAHNVRPPGKEACKPADTSSRCQGPVAVCSQQGGFQDAALESPMLDRYVEGSNAVAIANGGLVRVATGDMEKALRGAREAERARNSALYPPGIVAGHVPDATWGGKAEPLGGWLPMTTSLNSAIGRQALNYPIGYRATNFYRGQWVGGSCIIPES